MDGIVDALLRLEDAKHQALTQFDASAYEENVQAQLRLLQDGPHHITPDTNTDKLVQLASLVRVNTALYQNLLSTSPCIALAQQGYSQTGYVSAEPLRTRLSVEG